MLGRGFSVQEALYVRQNRNIRWCNGAVSGRNVILGIVLAAANVANLNQSRDNPAWFGLKLAVSDAEK